MKTSKPILLLSGGIDSFIAWHYLNKPPTLYFDLNTPYTEKEKAVVRHLAPDTIFDYSLIHLGANQVGDKAYIPYRNLYLAMEASKYSDTIIIAGIKGDDVSDKNQQVFSKFSALLSELENRTIMVTSPFWDMTKEQIIEWYRKNGHDQIDLVYDTVSCYSKEDTNYCGSCPSCFRKWVALVNNGFVIPFNDEELIQEYYMAALAKRYIPERNEAILSAVAKCAAWS